MTIKEKIQEAVEDHLGETGMIDSPSVLVDRIVKAIGDIEALPKLLAACDSALELLQGKLVSLNKDDCIRELSDAIAEAKRTPSTKTEESQP